MLAAVLGAAAIYGPTAMAQVPGETPFPAPKVGAVFAATQTVTPDGAENNYFAPGSTVVFRAYAVDGKTHKALVAKDVKYFYVAIPSQPNLKLKYDPKAPGATARLPWSAAWTVPTTYPGGVVSFKVLVKTSSKRQGQFVQFPVASSQLTITTSPPPVLTPAPSGAGVAAAANLDVSLYVDSVNGTRPAAAAPRPIGCTQTNVYKRGEQLVVRSWGGDLGSGDILSSENVDSAIAKVTGQPDVPLNWGAHGATTNRVWYWTGAWNIPTDYPLGDLTIRVVFKTDAGKTGTYDYKVTIIP
jgi:hypothetical protein